MTKFWHKELSNISDGAIFGENCIVHSHVIIYDDVVIGDNVKIQAFVFIPNGVTIGNNVFIGPRVTFTNDKYPPSNHKGWSSTVVEDGVSIGAGAVILPGLIIGKNSVIGAGSVVTKNVNSNDTVVGNPGKSIKYLKLKI